MVEFTQVGRSVPRIDAREKVTGKAMFSGDFKLPRMLYAKVLRSPNRHPHARIVRLDASRAEKLPGVRAVLTPRDVPDKRIGFAIYDYYVLPRDNVVRCAGQAVAAVAADTEDIAQEALKLIEVDYEGLPAVFDPEEAMRDDCPVIIHPDYPKYFATQASVKVGPEMRNVLRHFKIRHGDIEAGFKQADLIVENRFSTPRAHHCPIEPHTADAWLEPDGTLVVRASAQNIFGDQRILCYLLDLPPSQVRVLAPDCGGGFGGKFFSYETVPITALLARKTGRPVRLALSREEVFVATEGRIPVITYIKDGVKRDGTLVARELKMIVDVGAYGPVGAQITRSGAMEAIGTYRIPNFKLDSYGVYTNQPKASAFRGVGGPELLWAIEQQMDILAEKLGLDPADIRRKNILEEGDRNVGGMITHSIGVEECLDRAAAWIGWGKPPERVAEGAWRRGKGIAVANQYTFAGSTSVAIVKVHPNGEIEVRHNAHELGQGINTALAQIAAEEFSTSADKIKMMRGDTLTCPYDAGTFSSRCTFHTGNAVIQACRDAKRQIFAVAADKLGVTPEDLDIREGKIFQKRAPWVELNISALFTPAGVAVGGGEILGKGSFTTPAMPDDPATGQSERGATSFCHGACGVEVAVDVETGEVIVEKIGGCFDMGQPINPAIVEGQIEGGTLMGIGGAIYEEQIVNKGVVMNPNFTDYRVPTAKQMPNAENTAFMIACAPHREGPYGAKGIGEVVSSPSKPAIGNAVYNAIGIRIKDLPITPEKVLKALKEKESQQGAK